MMRTVWESPFFENFQQKTFSANPNYLIQGQNVEMFPNI